MGARGRFEEYQPLRSGRASEDFDDATQSDGEHPDDLELHELDHGGHAHPLPAPRRPRWLAWTPKRRRRRRAPRRSRSLYGRSCRLLALSPALILGLIVVYAVFFPSYSNPPRRYYDLRRRVEQDASTTGSANVNNEKIFVAASMYDQGGQLLSGDWGEAVLSLLDMLGPQNVYLSIYENDPDDEARKALEQFSGRVPCAQSLVSEHLDLQQLQHVSTPDGTQRLKRIEYLAEVRNRALRPLQVPGADAYDIRFDKLLYLNDVSFDPVEVANLLFSTNADEATGRTNYRAACAVDFINPFKFYDTFATRDAEGYRMGVPFYPWFASVGDGVSRRDVMAQTDAVRVKSCWSGMVSFEARWFQPWMHPLGISANRNESALRFRAETDTYWDASECCLINADLAAMSPDELAAGETGVYMNPYVRVAYSKTVLGWLSLTKRFERLYPLIHHLVNKISYHPTFNPRRLEQPGEEVVDLVWVWDDESLDALQHHTVGDLAAHLHGTYKEVRRIATPGQFCGQRKFSYINEHPAEGEKNWTTEKAPEEEGEVTEEEEAATEGEEAATEEDGAAKEKETTASNGVPSLRTRF